MDEHLKVPARSMMKMPEVKSTVKVAPSKLEWPPKSIGGTFGGGAFGGVTGWAGGDSTRARFTGREGLLNEKVDTVVLGPCEGPTSGLTAAEGAGRFRRSAALNDLNLGRK